MRWWPTVDDERLTALFRQHGDEIRRHFDVVAESLRAEIATVAEGNAGLGRGIDDLRDRLSDELRAVRAELTVMYSLLDRRLARLEPGGPAL